MRQAHGSAPYGDCCEGNNGRIYLSPNKEHIEAAQCPKPSEYPDGALSDDRRAIWTPLYGLAHFSDLFTSRQLSMLSTFSDLGAEAQKRAEEDALARGMADDGIPLRKGGGGALGYGEAVAVYLALAIDKAANMWSSLCGWMNDRGALRETFSRQAIPMVWDYAEANPFSHSGGNMDMFVGRCADVIASLSDATSVGVADQSDAQADCGLRGLMVSTDPPYYDNIGYADLSDFFYVWLRRSLKGVYPGLFRTMLTPKSEELIATPFRFDGSKERAKEFFEGGMREALKRIHDESQADVPATVYYAYKQSDDDSGGAASTGWETMLSSIIKAGFAITGTWPI